MILPPVTDWAGSARKHPYLVCDVFTDRPLQGNQLAVFLDGRAVPAELMQSVAREMNLAETVFLLPPTAGGDVAMRISSSCFHAADRLTRVAYCFISSASRVRRPSMPPIIGDTVPE